VALASYFGWRHRLFIKKTSKSIENHPAGFIPQLL